MDRWMHSGPLVSLAEGRTGSCRLRLLARYRLALVPLLCLTGFLSSCRVASEAGCGTSSNSRCTSVDA